MVRFALRPRIACCLAEEYYLFMSDVDHSHSRSDQGHTHHDHTHGTIDPALLTTQRGIWAVKWSLVGLGATAIFQVVIVFTLEARKSLE